MFCGGDVVKRMLKCSGELEPILAHENSQVTQWPKPHTDQNVRLPINHLAS